MQRLKSHLQSFIIDQEYDKYTAQDHAVWRYVMKQNLKYLPAVAHESYLKGIEKTGISIDHIPRLSTMNKILEKIGWSAVTVDGFIPPAAFMEFQANRVLPIAADIRSIKNIEYTPAPDIIHEIAGHAPIIANEEYADYLQLFGEVGSKAFSSGKDHQIFEAVRHLSILKANPNTLKREIIIAEKELEMLDAANTEHSEMTQIRNLHWWTVEYGLIGKMEDPKIYGAGLLSSIGESINCLKPEVKKIPLSLETKNVKFDITTQQPQLFVTPNFAHLNNVLKEFSKNMAFVRGGTDAVKKAIDSGKVATCTYSSGLQVSGVFSKVLHNNGQTSYLQTNSPSALSFENKQCEGHAKAYHKDGFGSPVGKLKSIEKPIENFDHNDLLNTGLQIGNDCDLEFESGVRVKGKLKKILAKEGKNLVFTFSNCLVTYEGKTLFEPAWGLYDMAVGEKITSAFSAPADPEAFKYNIAPPEEKTIRIRYSEKQIKLHNLYQLSKKFRLNQCTADYLQDLIDVVVDEYPLEWLLVIEILEVTKMNHFTSLTNIILNHIESIKTQKPEYSILLDNGIKSHQM